LLSFGLLNIYQMIGRLQKPVMVNCDVETILVLVKLHITSLNTVVLVSPERTMTVKNLM
jgi:hypothetical protein